MEYRKLGRTELDISVIGLGTMTWGFQNTQAQGFEQMDYALEHGVNFFDTAEMYGDGGTDIEPFTHLYKNQIYQLSDYLEVIPEIVNREPSPDTFSLPVSDQEFFFRISFDKLDYLLYAWEHEVAIKDAAKVLDLSEDAIGRAYKDFASKYRATAHIRNVPNTLEQ